MRTNEQQREYMKIYRANPANRSRIKEWERSASLNNYHRLRKTNPEYLLHKWAKVRARKKQLPFNITPKDIFIPQYCPILGIELKPDDRGFRSSSPSLDRITPELGYVKGNIQVISLRANLLKRDASLEDLIKLGQWAERNCVIKFACRKHPRYNAMKPPRASCQDCISIYEINAKYPELVVRKKSKVEESEVPRQD